MSLVGKVGRRRPKARLAMALVYSAMALGALTTLYPFLLMLATGLKGPTDQDDNRLIPAYFSDVDHKDANGKPLQGSLLDKYLADKYAGDVNAIASSRIGSNASLEVVKRYEQFLMTLPLDYWMAGFRTAPNQTTGKLTLRYQAWLQQRYPTIEALNKAYTEQNTAFQQVVPPVELLEQKVWQPVMDSKYKEWREFKATLPSEFRIPMRMDRLFQLYLRAKFKGQFDQVPKALRQGSTSFERVRFDEDYYIHKLAWRSPEPVMNGFFDSGIPSRLWGAPVETHWINAVQRFRVPMPIQAYEEAFVREHAPELKQEFATRNSSYVLGYIALNSRVLLNTFIFCMLAVLTQLIVNPLAAYALSRYPMRVTMKILLFLLATMAFPAEVAMIPAFLMLKSMGLLNTFAALVLPGAASGYMIFLLKGFFDSLPKELYEAGEIDGAKETTLMRRIALPLSAPVLGYLGLLAFMGAYGAFMYAFLVAQDHRIWTLMVWIYQLQGAAPKSVMMAALTIAAVPTLVIFLLAQRFILRGIVLPGEK